MNPWTTVNEPTTKEPGRLATLWRRISPAEHPIPWLAVCGAALVLVAALTSTTAHWADVPIAVRLGGMVFLHACIVAFAERWRRRLPSTTRVAAHLGAALFTPTAISVVASMHGSWRSCTLAGGLVGVAALEAQARRWHAAVMRAAEVAAVCVGAAGAAAITHLPLGALIGIASVCALMIGWERRAATLAGLAVATPILAVLARLRIGPGTIPELGATGAILRWGAPVAGVLSAGVFALLAARHPARRAALFGASAASLIISAGVSATFVEVPHYAWVWAALGFLGTIAGVKRNRPLGMIVGALFPVAMIGQLVDVGVDQTTTSALMIAIGIAAMGCTAAIRRGVTPLDAVAAVSLSGGALLIPSEITRWSTLLLAGAATLAVGFFHRHRVLVATGLIQASVGVLGLFNTVHVNTQNRVDIFFAIVVAVTAALEWWSRPNEGASGPQYAVASMIGGAYALLSLFANHTGTRLAAVLVLGLAAIAFGSLMRIPAITLTGTAVVAVTLAVATRRELTSMPTWAWMLLGGFALLGLAIAMERRKTAAGL